MKQKTIGATNDRPLFFDLIIDMVAGMKGADIINNATIKDKTIPRNHEIDPIKQLPSSPWHSIDEGDCRRLIFSSADIEKSNIPIRIEIAENIKDSTI